MNSFPLSLLPLLSALLTPHVTHLQYISRKAWPWHKQGPAGTWEPRPPFTRRGLASLPARELQGQGPHDQGKGGFYQLHESQCSGPMFCKTCVWQMTPCGLQKSRWRKFSKCNVRFLHLLIPTRARGPRSRSELFVHRTLQHGYGSGATFNSSR